MRDRVVGFNITSGWKTFKDELPKVGDDIEIKLADGEVYGRYGVLKTVENQTHVNNVYLVSNLNSGNVVEYNYFWRICES